MVIGTAMAAAALDAPFYFDPVYNRLLSQAIYLAIAAMGLNLLTGFNGQVSIGHGVFYGVGAFSAILMVDHGWTFEATIPVALVLNGVVGLLVGLPALGCGACTWRWSRSAWPSCSRSWPTSSSRAPAACPGAAAPPAASRR